MQVTQTDEKSGRRLGVEEELIKFKPSPNFKNMKKFLKNRSSTETSVPTTQASPTTLLEPKILEKLNKTEITKPSVLPPLSAEGKVQPPLPPYPPPPNTPPKLNVIIKQEKENDDVNFAPPEETHTDSVSKPLAEKPEEPNIDHRPKRTICKEFIRGNCTRPVCKYAHEVDVSQLTGVFTFCWDYQNTVCTFPNCKYVHATFFEEAEFYRTGVLPPHVRAQIQKQKQAPPRVPPPEEFQEMRTPNFGNPPPLIHPGADKPMPIITCVPTSALQRPEEDVHAPLPRSTSPLKRTRPEIDESSCSPRDLESDHLPKKCKNCEKMEFSLKCNKQVVANMIRASEDMEKKIGQITIKNTKLFQVITTVLKQHMAGKTALSHSLMKGTEKEKPALEHLSEFLGANNRLSSAFINNDNIKNMVRANVNLPSLMAKLLCGEQGLPQESSRET